MSLLQENSTLPAVAAVPEYDNFKDMSGETVFNQYASEEYMNYCKTVYSWNKAGYLGGDPVNYDSDTANRDNDFNNGKLFSYFIKKCAGQCRNDDKFKRTRSGLHISDGSVV